MSFKNLSGELRQDPIWLIQQIKPYSLPGGDNHLIFFNRDGNSPTLSRRRHNHNNTSTQEFPVYSMDFDALLHHHFKLFYNSKTVTSGALIHLIILLPLLPWFPFIHAFYVKNSILLPYTSVKRDQGGDL